MEYTTFGHTDLRVSRVCFGTWQYGGNWSGFDEAQAKAAIRRARELGINFFDTARAYGFGQSERLLGDALADDLRERRDEIVIATKGGLRSGPDGGVVRDASPRTLREELDASLHALGVDVIDLYQVHWPDPRTPVEDTARALQSFVDEGKVRYVGVSNWDVPLMEAFAREGKLASAQPAFHLFRQHVAEDVLPWCKAHDVGVLVYGPLAHGVLSGKYSRDTTFPEGDWRHGAPMFQGDTLRRNLDVVDRLKAFAESRGHSVVELAVAWVLAHPAVDAAIVGARKPSHIEGTATAAAWHLTRDDLAEVQAIVRDAAPMGGPSPEGPVPPDAITGLARS